jgi:hypothetical protein
MDGLFFVISVKNPHRHNTIYDDDDDDDDDDNGDES